MKSQQDLVSSAGAEVRKIAEAPPRRSKAMDVRAVRIPEELAIALRQLAQQHGASVSDEYRAALETWVKAWQER